MGLKTPIKAVLLDIGNVLLKINWQNSLKLIDIPNIKAEEFYSMGAWTIFHDYEAGLITREQFRKELCQKLKIQLNSEQFEKAWCACFDGEVEGVSALLKPLSEKVPLYTLSNTNELHFEFFKDFPIFEHFENLLASHTFHCRKPDSTIYQKAIRHLNCSPSEILFIDDLEENLQAAREQGIHAEHCFQSGLRFAEILRARNLL